MKSSQTGSALSAAAGEVGNEQGSFDGLGVVTAQRMGLAPGVVATAEFSPCETYRYALTRTWDPEAKKVLWIMLNPSTATENTDDPTVRRVQGFSRAWGFSGAVVANIFALRATDPKELYWHKEPIGPDNDRWIVELASRAAVPPWRPGASTAPWTTERRR